VREKEYAAIKFDEIHKKHEESVSQLNLVVKQKEKEQSILLEEYAL